MLIPEAETELNGARNDVLEAETVRNLPRLAPSGDLRTMIDDGFGMRGAASNIADAMTAVMPTELERWVTPRAPRPCPATAPLRSAVPMTATVTWRRPKRSVQAHIDTHIFGPETRRARTIERPPRDGRGLVAMTSLLLVAVGLAVSLFQSVLV